MNKDNARDYLPLVQALAEGKTIQKFSDGDGWEEVRSPSFESPAKLYRIKPEPKKGWYRVGLLKTDEGEFFTTTADSTDPYEDPGKISHRWRADVRTTADSTDPYEDPEQAYLDEWSEDFVRWLTDRIEYELPEGDA